MRGRWAAPKDTGGTPIPRGCADPPEASSRGHQRREPGVIFPRVGRVAPADAVPTPSLMPDRVTRRRPVWTRRRTPAPLMCRPSLAGPLVVTRRADCTGRGPQAATTEMLLVRPHGETARSREARIWLNSASTGRPQTTPHKSEFRSGRQHSARVLEEVGYGR